VIKPCSRPGFEADHLQLEPLFMLFVYNLFYRKNEKVNPKTADVRESLKDSSW
jgi:hypothetical protein